MFDNQKIPISKKLVLGTFLHAFVLLFLTLYWLSLPNIYSDEAFFIKWTSIIKKTVFNIDPKPDPAEVLFIDISQNRTTVPQLNDFEELSEYNQKVVTNRKHLAEFLALIEPYQDSIQHIFLDILFEDESPDDSLFLAQANRMRNKVLIATRINEAGKYVPPIFDLERTLTSYQVTQGLFLKYGLFFQDSLKTGSLSLLEKIDGLKSERKWGMNWVDDKLAMVAPIVDFKLRPRDFQVSTSLEEQNFSIQPLGTILELKEIIDTLDYFKNKIIVVGDYKNDIHQTVFGAIPGPLILFNAYLTLKDGSYEMSIWWLIFLFLSFWFLSFVAFSGLKLEWPTAFLKPQREWIEETLNESFLLILITILSYAIFNIHINILILIVYLTIITFVWKRWKDRKSTENKL